MQLRGTWLFKKRKPIPGKCPLLNYYEAFAYVVALIAYQP